MFDSAADITKTAALLLAVILPAIAALYSYRKERDKPTGSDLRHAGLVAIGGALASEAETFAYVEAMHKHGRSLDIQSEAMNRLAGAIEASDLRKDVGTLAAAAEQIGEELRKIRLEAETMNVLTKRAAM